MGDFNVRGSDPRNYNLPGSVGLFFRKKGSVDAKDWLDLGNLVESSIAPTVERLEHFSNRRGERAKDRSVITERQAQLDVTIDEINLHNLQLAFGSRTTPTAGAVDAKFDKIVANPGSGQTINLGMATIKAGSLVVRSVSLGAAETVYALTTDYTVVEATGIITITAGALADPNVVKEVHLYWEKNVTTKKFEIFDGTELTGQVQFQLMTPGGAQYIYVLNNVIVKNNGEITVGGGDTWQQIPLSIEVFVDADGNLGDCHVVDDASVIT